jgi:hypothetical protein
MPRLQPAPGYITASEAKELLKVSDSSLSQYVKAGWLKRYGPKERKYKFYKLSEVEALIASRQTFDEYQEIYPATFEAATLADMPVIVDMDVRTFHVDMEVETYARWFRKNPESFFVLRDTAQKVVGYACLFPTSLQVIDRFVRDEIALEDIGADDIELYEPGPGLHLYVIAVAVDPVYRGSAKAEYGAQLIRGLYTFLYDLARRGVVIETITARSYKPDGLRLLRKLGIPQLRSPIKGKQLFGVRVAESGFPAFVKYSEVLEQTRKGASNVLPD